MNLQLQIINLLQASLFRPLVLVATAWLILRLLRVRHPASRHAVWTAVLIGMLVLPVLSVVTPDWTLRVLPWSQDVAQQISAPTTPAVIADDNQTPSPTLPILSETETAGVPAASIAPPSIETLIAWAYMAGLAAMLAYRLMGWLFLRRVISRSRALRPACLRESADVVTPVAVGVFFPSVILPTGWRNWNARTKRAVLAHEFAHLHRRDTVVAALARVVKSVFWFHPVAWWVSRQTSEMAELACDAVALQRVGDPAGYSRVLVEFAGAVKRSGQRVALPGLAIASGSQMGKRIDEVFELSGGTMRQLARPMVWLVLIGLPALSLAAMVSPGASASAATQNAAAAADKSKFDVVSIKSCPGLPPPGGRGIPPGAAQISPGFVHWDCVTLSQLIDQAYAGVETPLLNMLDADRGGEDAPKRVRGGPSWVQSELFTLEAKSPSVADPAGTPGPRRYLRGATNAMVRALLEDRFQLKLRRATEQQSMYALTFAKGGLSKDKVTPTKPDDCWIWDPPTGRTDAPVGFEKKPMCGTVHGGLPLDASARLKAGTDPSTILAGSSTDYRFEYTGMTMKEVAQHLSSEMDHFVLDKTGFDGQFNFGFDFARDEHTPSRRSVGAGGRRAAKAVDPAAPRPQRDGPNIFKALEALGLRLEPTKGPAEYLVIDSVQRPRPNDPAVAPAAADRPDNTPDGSSAGPRTLAPAQNAAAPTGQVKFDVVSIKPCPGLPPTTGRGAVPSEEMITPGHVSWACVTLAELVYQSFAGRDSPLLNVPDRPREDAPKRVRGGPSWVDSDRFTIESTITGDETNLTGPARWVYVRVAMNPALRAVLADRFQLKVHRATEQIPMYALTLAKGGLNKEKMTPTPPGECWVWKLGMSQKAPAGFEGKPQCGDGSGRGGRGGISRTSYTGESMSAFASNLSGVVDRHVIDRTGVEGMFNFAFEYVPDDRAGAPADGPTLHQALASLGLKLEPTKGPAEYLVIDSVQKPKPNGPDPERRH